MAVANNVPEFIYAKGGELDMAVMRQAEPKKLFAVMDQIGAQVAARYENDQDD